VIARVLAVSLALALALAAAAAVTVIHVLDSRPAPRSSAAFTVTGIVADNLAAFDQRCGCRPDVAVKYIHWDESPTTMRMLADSVITKGAVPMLELEPFGVPLASIAEGRDDADLLGYASAVKSLHEQVLMSFEPEPNGSWYSWGYPHVSPATEVAAWRHVVTLFRRAGDRNVTWVWIINTVYHGSGPIAALWPGSGYVDEIGIDGYFQSSHDTFSTIFGRTFAALRGITSKPVLVSETSASPAAGQSRALGQLAAGVVRYGLAGFIWFDIDQAGQRGQGKADWSIDDDPSALAAYRELTVMHR
jgi:mannan endo-1,4-beta-mannosidase